MAAKSLLTLTDAAAERVKMLMSRADRPVLGLRVDVRRRGCSGLSYVVEYAEERRPCDEVVEEKGVTLFIDPAALTSIVGATMDVRGDAFSTGFAFDNPNETGRCGCGESFSVEQDGKTAGIP